MARHPPTVAKKCIFCGSTPLSKEHFWPNWAASLLKKGGVSLKTEHFVQKHKSGMLLNPKRLTRQGSACTFKIKIVCKSCNNGWMGRIEGRVKPILSEMIIGRTVLLSEQDQTLLATWITMKMIISEHHMNKSPITDKRRLYEFYKNPKPIDWATIWIALCEDDAWQTQFMTSSMWLSTESRKINHSSHDCPDNTQSITFGIGKLFVYVQYTTVSGLDLNMKFSEGLMVSQLWPIVKKDTFWPPMRSLTAFEANMIASSLERFFDSSHKK
jgi:hypothetical protein